MDYNIYSVDMLGISHQLLWIISDYTLHSPSCPLQPVAQESIASTRHKLPFACSICARFWGLRTHDGGILRGGREWCGLKKRGGWRKQRSHATKS
jgi:hypothetical protein